MVSTPVPAAANSAVVARPARRRQKVLAIPLDVMSGREDSPVSAVSPHAGEMTSKPSL